MNELNSSLLCSLVDSYYLQWLTSLIFTN